VCFITNSTKKRHFSCRLFLKNLTIPALLFLVQKPHLPELSTICEISGKKNSPRITLITRKKKKTIRAICAIGGGKKE